MLFMESALALRVQAIANQACHLCPAGELSFAQNQPGTSVPLSEIRSWHT